MSNSFIVEPLEGTSKKDDTLILMVNDKGVISVDQDTLQNLIINQSNATVSVVRLGRADNDVKGNITLTVDPPQFIETDSNMNNASDSTALVDPFMEMDPEQLERLETALQSEEAKQILGENVTAMLDMLTVEEQQNSIRYSIELDHCYTSRFSSCQLNHSDSLADLNSSDVDESICTDLKSAIHTSLNSALSESLIVDNTTTVIKQKTSYPPKVGKQKVSIGGRLRRTSTIGQPLLCSKSSVSTNVRTVLNIQHENKLENKNDEKTESELLSSESSDSQESDSDSDFGPRPFKRGVRARGGRRGLNTRGGNITASRRRGSNKLMDSEQVRRLDLEMAAAVNAMKSPEKEIKTENHSISKIKKQIKSVSDKKKDDITMLPASVNNFPLIETNVLQTTNQVKANIISANMFKGDMILTKPGQDRNNQKVMFVQKQALMPSNEIKILDIKKQVIIPKNKLITSQDSRLPMTKNSKPLPITTLKDSPPIEEQSTEVTYDITQQKVSPILIKTKPMEIKKEKKKIEITSENSSKLPVESAKSIEVKVNINIQSTPKKIIKKEHRKSDTLVAETYEPALFSTPDIIRRVNSISESKSTDNITTIATSIMSLTSTDSSIMVTTASTSTIPTFSSVNEIMPLITVKNALNKTVETNISAPDTPAIEVNKNISILSNTLDDKMDSKTVIAELLQPSENSVSNTTSSSDMSTTLRSNNKSKNVFSESSIEGDDHLLATLGMEEAKQLPNDEELLAEALLLQETLGVELDNNAIVDSAPEMSESILSSTLIKSTSPTMESLVEAQSIIIPVPSGSTTLSIPITAVKSESEIKKDSKEPVQIVRGGRIITLPPIEAPATRSKKLQAKTGNQQIKIEKKQIQEQQQQFKVDSARIKTERINRTSNQLQLRKQDIIYEMENNEEEEEEAEEEDEEEINSDSEDDPNRLWCICRQPHNNRFMICCDICQDWFHGKCVHVTKAMGEQMENQGIEWVCPNCLKKKNGESKSKLTSKKQKNSIDMVPKEQCQIPSVSSKASFLTDSKLITYTGKGVGIGITYCVVCKKEARKSSIYCSDACILAHAEVTSTKDKPSFPTQEKIQKLETSKIKSDVRIIVFDKNTGKVLTGVNAPTASNLKTWLKEHPTYEVVKSNNLNTIQLGGKTVAAIQTQEPKAIKQFQSSRTLSQTKMICSKVTGLKKTVLTQNTKKIAELTKTVSVQNLPQRTKQVPVNMSPKNTLIQSKQVTTKITNQQQHQSIPQKTITSLALKVTSAKKMNETKVLVPCQKQLQQLNQQKEQVSTKSLLPKKFETEPIRLNVRKTLAELLYSRINETNDLSLTEEEITELALQIELEMYKFFKDTGAKYKAKYRSLVFNIKDTKNLTLFRKIADRSLKPDAVVKLSPEEMASQELAEWREKENKHQLEMIKKNELDLIAQAKSIVVKTHKGEQIIESDGTIEGVDPQTSVQDIVIALNNSEIISSSVEENKPRKEKLVDEIKLKAIEEEEKKKKEKQRERDKRCGRSRERDSKDNKRDRSRSKSRYYRHSKDRGRDRSKDRKFKKDSKRKDKDKERPRDKIKLNSKIKDQNRDRDKVKDKKEKRKRSRSTSRSHSKSRYKECKDKHKKNEDVKKDSISKEKLLLCTDSKPIEDRLWRHIEDENTITNTLDGNDSDISDREPSSTVTIKTPDLNEEIEKEPFVSRLNEGSKGQINVWRGFVYMADVAKFYVTAQNVSGNAKELMEDLPDSFDVVGRINPLTVWDYISKMKKNAAKEILVIRLTATNDEEKIPYITLYSYLNSRNRLGVLGNISPNIKDFYIMPFSNVSKLPSVLLPLDGPGFEDNRQHLLLGIIVMHSKKKRFANIPSTFIHSPPKPIKKEHQPTDRSYTPPPVTLLTSNIKNEDNSLSSPQSLIQPTKTASQDSLSVISKIVPELSSKIALESSSSSEKMHLDDDDEPYSPGEPVDVVLDDTEDALSSSSTLKTSIQLTVNTAAETISPLKSSSELQRKMEELSRQIEEEKQQIQNISSSFLNDTSSTLPGLGLDTSESSNVMEAYSPSDVRSFTPPPQEVSKLTRPILDKVSNITIPPNLQEILANVKRQENSKVDPYLPSKPSATFLTTNHSTVYQNPEKYTSVYTKTLCVNNKLDLEVQSLSQKETKSTLSSLSDYDIMKKAEEELAAMAVSSAVTVPSSSFLTVKPSLYSPSSSEPPLSGTSFDTHR